MSSSTDSRGVSRGRCTMTFCYCPEYQGGSAGLKCFGCAHPPGKHLNLSKAKEIKNVHYSEQVTSNPLGYNSDPVLQVYKRPLTGPCKASGCFKLCHYEESVGEFDFCTPECRDKALLVNERQRLTEDLKALYENEMKQSSLPLASGRMSEHQVRQPTDKPLIAQETNRKQQQLYSAAVRSGVSDPPAPASQSSGRQTTFVEQFQKTSGKEFGLIVSERTDTLPGVLVVGFKCNTKAEDLVKSNKLKLLDVITRLNGKEANPDTFDGETRKTSSCYLNINRTVQFPSPDSLLKKTTQLKPTYVVAVWKNPSDYMFGFETVVDGTNIVTTVSEKTPARVCGLKFKDEILAWGFVQNSSLKVKKGVLTNVELENASAEKKTLAIVLVIKRPT